jgi:ketosteroid isomerase-like protein
MSQENIGVVRRAADVLTGTGDWNAMFELCHPDAEFRDLQNAPDMPEVVRGIEAIREVAAQWTDVYDEFRPEIYEFVDAHPWVVVDARWYGTGKGSDLVVDFHGADAFDVREGKIVRIVLGYPDVATAIASVGRLEE